MTVTFGVGAGALGTVIVGVGAGALGTSTSTCWVCVASVTGMLAV
jgi:hypothetical protein